MIPGTSKRVGKYILTDQLGKGQFGTVFKGFSEDNPSQLYAIKSLDKKSITSNPLLEKLFHAEVSIMQSINHPNIMPLYDFRETPNNYYLIMRLCSEGDFEQYMEKKRGVKFFAEEDAVDFLKQIMNGFQELRKNKVMHRDFKLANIFVDTGPTIVIGDFGFAKSGCEMTGTALGTPLTMAPEILEQRGNYSSKVDLWSIGAVFYKLLFENYPFIAESKSELYEAIKAGSGKNLKIDKKKNSISPEAEDLLRRLLTFDPKERIEWEHFFKHKLFDRHKKIEGSNLMASLIGELVDQNVDHENLFQTNQKNVVCCKEDEFINPENYNPNKNKKPDIIKKEEESMQITMQDKDINDCYDFFDHDQKKIEFIFSTVRKLRETSKLSPFQTLEAQLYVILVFLAKKGIILLYFNKESLKNKNNCFKLKGYEAFINNELGKKTIRDYESSYKRYSDYVQQLCDLSTIYQLDQIEMSVIAEKSMEVDLKDLDTKLCNKLNQFWKSCKTDPNLAGKSLKKSCQDLTLCIGLSIRCQTMLKFKINDKKFDWLKFYSSLSSLSDKNIIDRIQELTIIEKNCFQK